MYNEKNRCCHLTFAQNSRNSSEMSPLGITFIHVIYKHTIYESTDVWKNMFIKSKKVFLCVSVSWMKNGAQFCFSPIAHQTEANGCETQTASGWNVKLQFPAEGRRDRKRWVRLFSWYGHRGGGRVVVVKTQASRRREKTVPYVTTQRVLACQWKRGPWKPWQKNSKKARSIKI